MINYYNKINFMKIAFITNAMRNDMTGVGVYSKGLIDAFLKLYPQNKYIFIDFEKNNFNKKYLFLIKNPLPTKKMSLWFNYVALKLRNEKIDYIFNLTGTPHIVSFKQKEIFVIHDFHQILYPQFTTFRTFLYNKFFLFSSLNKSFRIIVNSNKTKNELMNLFKISPQKIFKLYLPFFNKKIRKPKKNISFPYLLTISNIDLRKNIKNLVSAFNLIKKNKENIPHKLIIIGKPGYGFKEIIQYIKESPFYKDIILTGYLPDEEKNYLLSKASVFIYIPFYEGLGIPILEAAYFKIPIISSPIPAAIEILKKNLFLVNPNNINGIQSQIKKAIFFGYQREKINKSFSIVNKIKSNQNIKKQIDEFLFSLR